MLPSWCGSPPLPARSLGAFRKRLEAVFGERLRDVRLFGSYARGDADEDSDVDLLVVVDELTDLEIGDVATAAARIVLATSVPLAPLPIATARLAELRRTRRALAGDLDREGIAV